MKKQSLLKTCLIVLAIAAGAALIAAVVLYVFKKKGCDDELFDDFEDFDDLEDITEYEDADA